MVPVLVILTMAAFLLLDLYWVHRKRKAAQTLTRACSSPDGHALKGDEALYFHPGHTWVRLTPDGTATLGVCDVVAHLAGRLDEVQLPAPGRRMQQGQAAWTLTSARGRSLTQVMPLSGQVLATNDAVLRDPGLLLEDPYGNGWLVKTRIRNLESGLRHLLSGQAARQWMDRTRASLASTLQPALGHAALDGGTWHTAFGDDLDSDQWHQIRDEIVGAPGALAQPGPQPVRMY
jgi:glycine cleavage system H protein